MARVVVPHVPHHVVQRGNRRQTTFFEADDYRAYLALLRHFCRLHDVRVWCWALMPNHVHLVAVPSTAESLARAVGGTHEAYTRMINARHEWRGYLWQGRFFSNPMDEAYALEAVRYVLRNPVEAGLAARAADWMWSSARTHLTGLEDELTTREPLDRWVGSWESFLAEPLPAHLKRRLEKHVRTGRPVGSDSFLRRLEVQTGRRLVVRRGGAVGKGDTRLCDAVRR